MFRHLTCKNFSKLISQVHHFIIHPLSRGQRSCLSTTSRQLSGIEYEVTLESTIYVANTCLHLHVVFKLYTGMQIPAASSNKKASRTVCYIIEGISQESNNQLQYDVIKKALVDNVYFLLQVAEKSVSGFKKKWVKILSDTRVSEPASSVRWILQHVLKARRHDEVRTLE